MIQSLEVEPLPSFPLADKTEASHHVTGGQLSGKVTQFIGRRKRQPRAHKGLNGDMSSAQDVDFFNGCFEGRR